MALTRRTKKIFTIAAWCLAIGFLAYRSDPQLAGHFGSGSVGTAMPALSTTTIEGAPLNRADLIGKVVLVNFWASWCGPCLVEMPAFQRIYAERKDSGFVILGVWTQDADVFTMREQLRMGAITYPIVVGTPDLVASFGGVNGLPISLLFDRTGHIRKRVFGVFAESALRAEADSLLREVPGRIGGQRRVVNHVD
ncbi:MAG: TlpA disulfide reductase family protein [Gemmatimonadaceae bacterium]